MIGRSRVLPRCAGFGVPLVVLVLVVGGGIALASQRTITPSEARAVAMAIRLRHSDLPNLKKQGSAGSAQSSAEEAACIGETPPSEDLAVIKSATFVGPEPTSLTVVSDTEIAASAAVAANNLAAGRRPRALTCVRIYGGRELRASLPKGQSVTIHTAWLPAVVSGADGVAAVRLKAVLHVKQGQVTVSGALYFDFVEFAYGQAEVTLTVASVAAVPSSSLEARLLALLVERARAAIG
jgi:hypothetical protein